MATSDSSAARRNAYFGPGAQSNHTQTRTRFSFAPPTPVQLQRSEFPPSSPTNSDIDASTISSVSPYLPPISRSISVIAEQRTRQAQNDRSRRSKPSDIAPIHELGSAATYNLANQQGHTRREQSNDPGNYGNRLELQNQTPTHQKGTDKEDAMALRKPYHMQAQDGGYPSQPIPYTKDGTHSGQALKEELKPAPGLLFPAYGPHTTLYSPNSLARPDLDDLQRSHDPSISKPLPSPSQHYGSSLCGMNSICFSSIFCPCITYGKTQYRLGQKSAGRPATDLLGYSASNSSCLLMTLGCCFAGVLATIQRARIRKAYGIQGTFGDDLIRSCCCCCCVLAQNENEVVDREEKAIKAIQVKYISPLGMAYPPPPGR